MSGKSSDIPPGINGARAYIMYLSWLMFPFSLKLSPETICIACLRHKQNTVSSCLGPQNLQEQIINLKSSIQFFFNNLRI